jgi:hypothetical protein
MVNPGGAVPNWPNFQTPLLLMKLWDLLENVFVVVDRKFEQKIHYVEKFELMTPWAFLII